MIPNGSSMYYTKRSQPPFFIPMVQLYLHATNDTEFIRSYIDVIEKSTYFGILIKPWIFNVEENQ
ncbi:hypothetical protein DPMN_190318 [Dreissena polymorpha]|uniref:Trehalase n=1 Tax=Dreissena polymorpha TaxID=45954 RepID=A0A9D4IBM2_DREPO|nr:hypothetical protein DPMN_190318 [Dreissena polymorpha]